MTVDASIEHRTALHPAHRPKRPRGRHVMKWVGAACLAFLAYVHSPAWAVTDVCHFSNGRRSLDRPWDLVSPLPLQFYVVGNALSRHPLDLQYKLRWRAGRPVWIMLRREGFAGDYLYFDLAGFLIASASWGCQAGCDHGSRLVWQGPALDSDPARAFFDVAAAAGR